MKNKAISKAVISLTLSLSLFLSSCSTLKNEKISWRKYYNQNKELKEISFLAVILPSNYVTKKFDIIGSARINNGEKFNVFNFDNKKKIGIIDLDNNQAIKKATLENLNKLPTKKSIRLFEFGTGILEIADFHAQNEICKDFKSNKGVEIKYTTNYYKEYDTFATTFASSTLSQKKRHPMNSVASVASYPNTAEAKALEKEVENNRQQIIDRDATKLSSFLLFICNLEKS